MHDPTKPDGWFEDVFTILHLVQAHDDLSIPAISATRATFRYTTITHAKDTAEQVARAETILTGELHLTFERDEALAGDDTLRYILRAFMPSGLAVDIVARAEHMAVAA